MHIDAFLLLRAKYAIFTRKIVNFAYFHKIKTTSLIISCIKHLHISFCTHFEAFSCILTHSEHLEQNVENSIVFKENYKFFSKCSECINMHQNASKCVQNEMCKCFVHENIKKWFYIAFKGAKICKILATLCDGRPCRHRKIKGPV